MRVGSGIGSNRPRSDASGKELQRFVSAEVTVSRALRKMKITGTKAIRKTPLGHISYSKWRGIRVVAG